MSNKPKITIKNFSGMGDNGMYYLEGMSARKLQGQGILTSSWNQTFQYSEDTTGFTGMERLKGATAMANKELKTYRDVLDKKNPVNKKGLEILKEEKYDKKKDKNQIKKDKDKLKQSNDKCEKQIEEGFKKFEKDMKDESPDEFIAKQINANKVCDDSVKYNESSPKCPTDCNSIK